MTPNRQHHSTTAFNGHVISAGNMLTTTAFNGHIISAGNILTTTTFSGHVISAGKMLTTTDTLLVHVTYRQPQQLAHTLLVQVKGDNNSI